MRFPIFINFIERIVFFVLLCFGIVKIKCFVKWSLSMSISCGVFGYCSVWIVSAVNVFDCGTTVWDKKNQKCTFILKMKMRIYIKKKNKIYSSRIKLFYSCWKKEKKRRENFVLMSKNIYSDLLGLVVDAMCEWLCVFVWKRIWLRILCIERWKKK